MSDSGANLWTIGGAAGASFVTTIFTALGLRKNISDNKKDIEELKKTMVSQTSFNACQKLQDERHDDIKALIKEIKDDNKLSNRKLDAILINVSQRERDVKPGEV